jgi:hypothetical protein
LNSIHPRREPERRQRSRRSSKPEELHQARADDDEDHKEHEKKKKTKLRVMPLEEVDSFLNYEYESKFLKPAALENRVKYRCFETMVSVASALQRRQNDLIRAAQEEDMRRQIETKGVYTYELTDGEAEDAGHA